MDTDINAIGASTSFKKKNYLEIYHYKHTYN